MQAAVDTLRVTSTKWAEQSLISGEELRQSCGGNLNYVSSNLEQKALRSLGLPGRERQVFEALSAFADTLRPFEIGAYQERGFLRSVDSIIVPTMHIKLPLATLKAEFVGAGHFASVFKISSESGKAFALKVYYQRNCEDFTSGPWSESALGIYITAKGVRNMPHLCLACPERGWILTEFVDSQYQSPTPLGPTWTDLGLCAFDNAKKDPNEVTLQTGQKMRVDYGHMATKEQGKLPQSTQIREKLLQIRGENEYVPAKAFLQLFWSEPQLRKSLLFELACLAPEDRLAVLKEALGAPQAEYLSLPDYLPNGVIAREKTRELFDLLMTHPNPQYRAQGIFDIRKLSTEDANYLGENWYAKPEFLPFLVYLGEKPWPANYTA